MHPTVLCGLAHGTSQTSSESSLKNAEVVVPGTNQQWWSLQPAGKRFKKYLGVHLRSVQLPQHWHNRNSNPRPHSENYWLSWSLSVSMVVNQFTALLGIWAFYWRSMFHETRHMWLKSHERCTYVYRVTGSFVIRLKLLSSRLVNCARCFVSCQIMTCFAKFCLLFLMRPCFAFVKWHINVIISGVIVT